MFIDVAKYIATIVVIGGLFSERIHLGSIALGIALAIAFVAIEYLVIPPEENTL